MNPQTFKELKSKALLRIYREQLSAEKNQDMISKSQIEFALYVLNNKVEESISCIELRREYEKLLVRINKTIPSSKNVIHL